MNPAEKLRSFTPPEDSASYARMENALRDIAEHAKHVLNEEEITTFHLGGWKLWLGIFIGMYLGFGLFYIDAQIGFLRWIISPPELSWVL